MEPRSGGEMEANCSVYQCLPPQASSLQPCLPVPGISTPWLTEEGSDSKHLPGWGEETPSQDYLQYILLSDKQEHNICAHRLAPLLGF